MKRAKALLLGLGIGMMAFQWGQCGAFWGDILGDIIVLGAVD